METFNSCVKLRPIGRNMINVAIVDYGSGNVASVRRALLLAADRLEISLSINITRDPDQISQSDKIILPGQGAFRDCAQGLKSIDGLWESIDFSVRRGSLFLGICVGMQLMAQRGLEHGTTSGFGWITGDIEKMSVPSLRLPHMGWNNIWFESGNHPLLFGISPGDHVYFVHSYGLVNSKIREILATADYGGRVPAIVARDNYVGTQFHVEKSQDVGVKILSNFLRWTC